MEENIAQIHVKKFSGKFKKFLGSFFLSLLWAAVFIIVCIPFLLNVENLPNSEKAFIGGVNLMRVVLGFGLLSLITSYFFVFKHNGYKLVALFLWAFWILGIALVLFILSENGGIQIYPLVSNNKDVSMRGIGTMLVTWPLLVWIYSVYFSRKIATQLAMNKSVATLSGIFLPVLSILIYSFFLYRTKIREVRIRIMKIGIGVSVIIIFAVTGAYYYIVGTPEYSLYRLKEALISSNDAEVSKYLDIGSLAENFGETPSQTKEWIDSLNVSVLEIKEENPDKSKDAAEYISTGLSGKYVKDAYVDYSGENSNYQIALQFDKKGSELFSEITKRNLGKSLAIYLSDQLISSPVVQSQIDNGAAVISGKDANAARFIVDTINEEKISSIGGFEIRKKIVEGNSAKVIIGKTENADGFELTMTKTEGRYWKINKIDVTVGTIEEKLPAPEGGRTATFSWKYKGKNYSLDRNLYDSYYKFYNALPAESVFNGESLIEQLEKRNGLFISETYGDTTISELAQSIKSIGEENNLSDNQIVELVASFVQTIPYDYDEYNNRESVVPKIDYPYETLYKNKGICSDKSYLAYSLLRKLGYGASFFEFPEDHHIAVGVECPPEYSNYDSGYCFLETTSLGNKIGSTPSIIKESGIAASEIVLSDYGTDATEDESSPLGKIEVLNKTNGLVYTGIIDTVNTQKEIDSLLSTIRRMDRELNASRRDLDSRDEEISRMVDKLDKLEKNITPSNYDDYSDYFSKYKKAYSSFEKDRKAFNAKIATRNQLNDKYNSLVRSFYQ